MTVPVSRLLGDNPFWPYDLSRPATEPSPLRWLAWAQHARLAGFARTAARATVVAAPPIDQGVPPMQATVTAALDAGQLAEVMALLEDADVVLGAFTEEELAAVDPPGDEPLVPLLLLDPLPAEERDQVLGSALRSLLARGLVQLGDEPGQLLATGSLSTVLALRGGPNSVLIVEHVEEEAPARRVVYGQPLAGDGSLDPLLMEESVAVLGHHEFVLRSVAGEAQSLAEWLAETDGEPAGTPDLDAALAELRSVSRLYALRRDDAGDEPSFSELELTLVDGGPHGRWMVLFQPAADGGQEGILAVPVGRLDLPSFCAGLLRFDLGPFNAALAAGNGGVRPA